MFTPQRRDVTEHYAVVKVHPPRVKSCELSPLQKPPNNLPFQMKKKSLIHHHDVRFS